MVEVGSGRQSDELTTVSPESPFQGVEGSTASPADLAQQLTQGAGGGEEIETAIGGGTDHHATRILFEELSGAAEQVEVEIGNVRAHHDNRTTAFQRLVEGTSESGTKAVATLETKADVVGELEGRGCRHRESVAGATSGIEHGVETGAVEPALETLARGRQEASASRFVAFTESEDQQRGSKVRRGLHRRSIRCPGGLGSPTGPSMPKGFESSEAKGR